jgi:RimJ/RimL family protein N-acetyltransferase
MFAAAADPGIWALHPASDRYTEPVFRKFFDGALASGSGFTFIERESGKIIGSSRYHAHNPALSEIEIGWTFLARTYWGGDYNREIKRLMLEHAFKFVDTVLFWVGDTNWRSQAAMEKIGGVRRPGPHSRAPDFAPHVVFEIRRCDFHSSAFWKDG